MKDFLCPTCDKKDTILFCSECLRVITENKIKTEMMELKEKIVKIIDELGEFRNKDNTLSCITFKDVTSNTIKYIKKELKLEIEQTFQEKK